MSADSRYPYTYSCDYLRVAGPVNNGGVVLSRSDASQIRAAVAVALGMADEELARNLADYYRANEEAISDESSKKLLRALNISTTE